eukprot:scaffold55741_cov30-Phaeocystis_antarctica.AAC.1
MMLPVRLRDGWMVNVSTTAEAVLVVPYATARRRAVLGSLPNPALAEMVTASCDTSAAVPTTSRTLMSIAVS